jgi:hypothetical protein
VGEKARGGQSVVKGAGRAYRQSAGKGQEEDRQSAGNGAGKGLAEGRIRI